MYIREQTGKSSIGISWDTFSAQETFLSCWPDRIIRFFLAGVFLWSGISKLIDPKSFAVIIEAFGLIPESWVTPVSVGLPALEIITAIGLLADIRGSLTIVTVLLLLFIAILGYGIWMGLDIDCGCFGPEDPEADAYHRLRSALYRDVVMMAGVFYLYFWRYCRSVSPVRLRLLFKHKSIKED